MSADKKQPDAGGGNPFVPPKVPDTVTMEQVRELNQMHLQQYREITEMYQGLSNHLKDLLKDSGLKFWIVAAGLGAIIETLRIGWLAIRFIFRF
jgi:hypothetical protein